jgi:hypothetical protein
VQSMDVDFIGLGAHSNTCQNIGCYVQAEVDSEQNHAADFAKVGVVAVSKNVAASKTAVTPAVDIQFCQKEATLLNQLINVYER